ncbi:MAG: S8 family serine peptidase [bacterium]
MKPIGIIRSASVVAFLTTVALGSMIAWGMSRLDNPSRTTGHLTSRVLPLKPAVTQIDPAASASCVVVKFRDESAVRYCGSRFVLKNEVPVGEINRVLKGRLGTGCRRLFSNFSEARLDCDRQVWQWAAKQELADLNSYFCIDVSGPIEAEQIINDLNRLDVVEITYLQPTPEPAADIPPPTPDYQADQDYRKAAPVGIDADYANSLAGGDGSGVMIIDIEGAWQTTHEDLDKAASGIILGEPVSDPVWRNHGTAVIGTMIAGDNGYGVTGICPGADIGMVSVGNWSTAEAIYAAIDTLQAGDIILIELHAPGPRYNFQPRPDQLGYVCMEYWQANYDAMLYAWAKGIVVVEPAANGAEDLDDVLYGSLFDTTWRNSHAIMVGAGYPAASADDLKRQDFSNYGARVNLQGYGSDVYSTGYGNLFDGGGDEDQYYTAIFNGTSAASPIVAGAAACLQGHYRATYGMALTADIIRDILVATGTPQAGDTSEQIGPRPDLLAAVVTLTGPPSLYAKPIFIDTVVSESEVGVVELWLVNRSGTTTFDFDIIGNDSLVRLVEEDWLSAAPQTGSVPADDSVRIDITLDATVIEDRIKRYSGVIEVSWGPSGGSLDSMIFIPVFMEVPCLDTTYLAISSDDSGGPAFGWISAKDLGARISHNAFSGYNPLDDGTAGPLWIGFDMIYFDSSYDMVHVGVNGGISFTDDDLSVDGFFSSFDIPGAPFATFLAPFWNDLVIDTAGVADAGVYLYRSPAYDTCVIEWYHLSSALTPDDSTINFEVVLTEDGHILFQYRDIGGSGLEQSALIGISEEGCLALCHFDDGDIPQNIVSDSEAVRFVNTNGVWTQSGDVDGEAGINVGDLTYLVAYLFQGGPEPQPPPTGDVDCSGGVDVGDLTYLVAYLFQGGPEPCYFWLEL